LTATLDYQTAPQWAIANIDYSAVPEPASMTGVAGLLAASVGFARRFRR
jgi:hypothetical protein